MVFNMQHVQDRLQMIKIFILKENLYIFVLYSAINYSATPGFWLQNLPTSKLWWHDL